MYQSSKNTWTTPNDDTETKIIRYMKSRLHWCCVQLSLFKQNKMSRWNTSYTKRPSTLLSNHSNRHGEQITNISNQLRMMFVRSIKQCSNPFPIRQRQKIDLAHVMPLNGWSCGQQHKVTQLKMLSYSWKNQTSISLK